MVKPHNWSKFLAGQPETGMDYHVVAVTLRDGRVIQDVAVIGSSMVNEVRGFLDIPFDPYEITDIEVTHKKWNFQSECQS
jgi:hypothetical protein